MVILWSRLVADPKTWRRRAWLFLALTVAGMAGLATLPGRLAAFLVGKHRDIAGTGRSLRGLPDARRTFSLSARAWVSHRRS